MRSLHDASACESQRAVSDEERYGLSRLPVPARTLCELSRLKIYHLLGSKFYTRMEVFVA